MASKRPKLPPEIPVSQISEDQPARRVHVHVVPSGDGWGIRVGRRIEKSFATRFEASKAAIPFARERGSRLFVHHESGQIREASTDEADEMFLDVWKRIYDSHNQHAD